MRALILTCSCALVLSCGRRSEQSSASGSATTDEERYRLVTASRSAPPTILTARGDRARVLDDRNRVVFETTIRERDQLSAMLLADWLLWESDKSLQIANLRTRETKVVPTEGEASDHIIGTSSIARFEATGVQVIDLASAESLRLPGAVRGVYDPVSRRYVMTGDHIHFVDEVDLRVLWSNGLDSTIDDVFFDRDVTVVGNQRFAVFAATDGKRLAHGDIVDDSNTMGHVVARRGTRFYRYNSVTKALRAYDLSGKLEWSFRSTMSLVDPKLSEDSSEKYLAVQEQRTLVMLDSTTGKQLHRARLTSAPSFSRWRGDCFAIVEQHELRCIETTGAERWSYPLAGGERKVWSIGDTDLLLADDIPLHLSRISGTGERLWSLELSDAGLDDAGIVQAGRRWALHGNVMLTRDPDEVIDLTTGRALVLQ